MAVDERLHQRELELLNSVSPESVTRWLEHFADFGVRLAGTDSEHQSARYVVSELERLGIDASLEEFDSFVSHGDPPEAFGPACVTVQSTGDRFDGRIYAFSASTPPDGIAGEVIWVGSGSPAAYDELAVDLRGKIALCELSFEAAHSESARIAEERGALGLIVANWSLDEPDQIHTSVAAAFWGNPERDDLRRLPRIPVLAVSNRSGQRLRQAASSGATVRLDVHASNRWVRAVQPVATIPGASERFILVYCHLDTLGPGMTDNTTGVVGLLELARLLSQRRDQLAYSVRLAWFSSHEMLYNGSTAHLDANWDEYVDRCLLTLNLDSWAIGESQDQLVLWTFAELEEFLVQSVADGAGVRCQSSDFDIHEAEQTFWPLGAPSAMLFSWNASLDAQEGMQFTGPWWHSQNDTLDRVGRDALLQLIRAQALLTYRLSTNRELPFSCVRLGERIEQLVDDIHARAPEEVGTARLVQAARQFTDMARRAHDAISAGEVHGDPVWSLMLVTRHLNPVLYTIAGPYGQDPCAATYLRKRFPGLQRELDELATLERDDPHYRAGLVNARRERNRVCDAILFAYDALRDLCEPLASSLA